MKTKITLLSCLLILISLNTSTRDEAFQVDNKTALCVFFNHNQIHKNGTNRLTDSLIVDLYRLFNSEKKMDKFYADFEEATSNKKKLFPKMDFLIFVKNLKNFHQKR